MRSTALRAGSTSRQIAGFFVFILLVGSLDGCDIRHSEASREPDLVLITVDTLRADHLTLYGYDRPTSPAITRLGREGLTFSQAIAPAPWTLPSMASVHTGAAPHRHGAIDNATPIDPALPTLAELLQAYGYRTVAVTSQVLVGGAYGFGRGFDVFDESIRADYQGSTSKASTEAALTHLAADETSPTFLWVHYFDPHYDYERHPEYAFAEGPRGRFGDRIAFTSPDGRSLLDASPVEVEYMRGVYDEEIAHTDHWIGRLIAGIRKARADRDVVFLLTADHGEAFLEHGTLAHGRDLYDELIRVPLILAGDIDPSLRGTVCRHPVETASIATTLLRLAGVETSPLRGVDLIETALGRETPPFAISEGSHARARDGSKVAIVQGDWKLIHNHDPDDFELYDRGRDPGERRNLVRDETSQALLSRLRPALLERSNAMRSLAFRPEHHEPGARLDSDEKRRLSALGYLDGETAREAEVESTPPR